MLPDITPVALDHELEFLAIQGQRVRLGQSAGLRGVRERGPQREQQRGKPDERAATEWAPSDAGQTKIAFRI